MPRIHFADFDARSNGYVELLIPRPQTAPDGYTPVMLVSEWLTLNCQGDWACRAGPKGLRVRFADGADRRRAAARFTDAPDRVVGLTDRRPKAPRAAGRGRARVA